MSSYVADVQRIQRRIDAIAERHQGFELGGISLYYIRLIVLTGIGWAIDGMETVVFIYMAYSLANVGGYNIPMTSAQRSFLNGSVFIGFVFGGFIAGSMMDRYGRRPTFMLAVFIILLGMGLCGTSWDITSLTLFRLFSGLGMGAALPVSSTLVQELSPQKIRGRNAVLLLSFWAIGTVLAVVLAYYVAPRVSGTWRTVYFLCTSPIIYCIAIRWILPESPKWLASVGRYEEAVAAVEKLERAHKLEPLNTEKFRDQGLDPSSSFVLPDGHIARIALLFQSQFRVRTIVLWTLWTGMSFSYYAIFIMLPGLIGATKTSDGSPAFDIKSSPSALIFIVAMQLPGYFTAATLVEYIGRRHALVTFVISSFVFGIAFAYVDPTQTNIIITASGLSVTLQGGWGCVYAYTPENYPTAIRGIGTAYPAGFGRIGAFMGPYICTWLLEWGVSLHVIMWIIGGVQALLATMVLVWGFEAKGKDIESYSDGRDVYHPTSAIVMEQMCIIQRQPI